MFNDRPHKRLDAWQLSMELCRDVYELCRLLPVDEKFGLAVQLKRAAVSVPSNIAEGAARRTRKEFIQFLGIARGSLAELDTQLELCTNYLCLMESDLVSPALEKATRVARLIAGLMNKLNHSPDG